MKTFTIDNDNSISVFASKKEAAAASTTPFDPFTSQSELAELATDWPMSRLIEIWNGIPGVTAVTKFTSRKIAVERIWKAIQNLEVAAPKPEAGATERSAEEMVAEPAPVQAIAETQTSLEVEVIAVESQSTPEAMVPATENELTPPETVADIRAQAPDVAPAGADLATTPTRAKKAPKAPKQAASPKATAVREGSKTATVVGLLERTAGATLAEIMTSTGWQAHSVRGFISGTLGKKMGRKVDSTKREDGERVYTIAK
jgi:Protein of unknown function (DUF3489)